MNYKELKESDKNGIHEVLFQMDIIGLEDNNKVEQYYEKLPEHIKRDGIHWGFSDSVVQDSMYDWFEKNIPLGLVVKCKRGPMSEPIIFNSITEGMEYFRTHP